MAGLNLADGITGGEIYLHETPAIDTALDESTRIASVIEVGNFKESAEEVSFYRHGAANTHQIKLLGKKMLEDITIKITAGSAIADNANLKVGKSLFFALEAKDPTAGSSDADIIRFTGLIKDVEKDHSVNDAYADNITITPTGKPLYQTA